jgi:hypothetical protein
VVTYSLPSQDLGRRSWAWPHTPDPWPRAGHVARHWLIRLRTPIKARHPRPTPSLSSGRWGRLSKTEENKTGGTASETRVLSGKLGLSSLGPQHRHGLPTTVAKHCTKEVVNPPSLFRRHLVLCATTKYGLHGTKVQRYRGIVRSVFRSRPSVAVVVIVCWW